MHWVVFKGGTTASRATTVVALRRSRYKSPDYGHPRFSTHFRVQHRRPRNAVSLRSGNLIRIGSLIEDLSSIIGRSGLVSDCLLKLSSIRFFFISQLEKRQSQPQFRRISLARRFYWLGMRSYEPYQGVRRKIFISLRTCV
jgi:hypothetical protein